MKSPEVCLCVVFASLMAIFFSVFSLRRSRDARPVLRPRPRPAAFRMYVSGEPVPWESPSPYDLCILAGGHNLYPNAFHLPLLALEKGWKFDAPVGDELTRSRPIDVLFRSSARCTHPRVAFAAHIRARCEERNLNFVSAGQCLRGSGDSNSWGECDLCLHAKVILSLEAFQHEATYLSEKPFLPLAMGAAGVYVGNGLDLLHETGANPERFIYVGSEYTQTSAEDAANATVEWLESPARIQRCLSSPAFSHEPLSADTLNMDAVQEFLSHDPKLLELRKARRALRCFFEGQKWSLLQYPLYLARLLGVHDVVECGAAADADIILKHCCAD